jgi:two-component system response regulator QseB
MRVDSHDVLVDGNKVALRPKEYALLELLLRRKDQVLSYAVIAESVWGDQRIVTSLNIKGLIHDLRGKLGPVGDKIEAIPHIGYKLLGD